MSEQQKKQNSLSVCGLFSLNDYSFCQELVQIVVFIDRFYRCVDIACYIILTARLSVMWEKAKQ